MKRILVLTILLAAGFVGSAQAQAKVTKLVRIKVDETEVKTAYKVLFLVNGNWFEAENTPDGFIAPREIEDQQKLTVRFIFNDYDLEFSPIDRSILNLDWVVGVDLPPYAEEFVKPEEMAGLLELYYLQYGSAQLVVTTRKPQTD